MKAAKFHIALGDPGIESTLRHMRRLVLRASSDPSVLEWAQGVVRFAPERDPDAAAQAFLSWTRANVRYTEDPVDVEAIKEPAALLLEWATHGRATGDCDDQVTIIAAGLNAIGVPTEFIVVAADPSAPSEYSHVLLQYMGRSGWVTMDPIVRGTGLGWFPPRHSRVGRYSGGRLMRGLGGSGLSQPCMLDAGCRSGALKFWAAVAVVAVLMSGYGRRARSRA